ncbi:TetR/AcrR family transcriptional regulator [Phenylobacterium aquaticum]|uniref:TetR/AcrR family transcriptional regulator n=1 Tax=Phenylobacterium aquaticum TaxID=1763816 RepID=UPI001F5E1FFE|nr:TetR/AcrR family transcriptional regulator [Phenylobacterium aquaticum]MCI3133911.1 TetR/AcrR family transcriptional regulator [Phenylobacterium aquaticum]
MASDPAMTEAIKTPRRSQAERTAAMRARLIDAAVVCLNRLGYSATTLATIAEEAGVSRGGMLHQFPSKVDLMLAVVAFASGYDERPQAPRALNDDGDKRAQFIDQTDTVWRAQTTPAVMAKLEIMVAARSDPQLADQLPAMFNAIEARRRSFMIDFAREIGVDDAEAIESMVTLHMAAMRGLSLEMLLTDDPARIERAYGLLKRYKEDLVDRLMAEAAAKKASA